MPRQSTTFLTTKRNFHARCLHALNAARTTIIRDENTPAGGRTINSACVNRAL